MFDRAAGKAAFGYACPLKATEGLNWPPVPAAEQFTGSVTSFERGQGAGAESPLPFGTVAARLNSLRKKQVK
jgi:hypothetical protein